MEAIDPLVVYDGARKVIFGEGQPQFVPLPALILADGTILIEWSFTKEERARIAKGENIRHWIWKQPACECGRLRLFEPVMLELTKDLHG